MQFTTILIRLRNVGCSQLSNDFFKKHTYLSIYIYTYISICLFIIQD